MVTTSGKVNTQQETTMEELFCKIVSSLNKHEMYIVPGIFAIGHEANIATNQPYLINIQHEFLGFVVIFT